MEYVNNSKDVDPLSSGCYKRWGLREYIVENETFFISVIFKSIYISLPGGKESNKKKKKEKGNLISDRMVFYTQHK